MYGSESERAGVLLYEEFKKCVSATKRIYRYSAEEKQLVSKRVEEFLRQQRVMVRIQSCKIASVFSHTLAIEFGFWGNE